MARMLSIFAVLALTVDATSHYAQPPCQSDEVELVITDYRTNYTGKVCAPACGDNDSCPTDKPPSAAAPKCLLHDSGKKYCGLKCFLGCGNDHMTCLAVDKTHRVCAYRHVAPKPTPPKATPCCQGHCANPAEAKYYSIAKSLWGTKHCGECCMEPKKYNLFHHFESNLTKADNDSPCKVFGYPIYDSTATHGFGPISMTLDLYNLPKEEPIEEAIAVEEPIVEEAAATPCCQGHCANPAEAKYYSIAKSLWGTKHCGECCMEPKKYNLFHHFEANLTKADNDSPCKVFGYPIYDSTATHGFGPISMTLDLYNLPKESMEEAAIVV